MPQCVRSLVLFFACSLLIALPASASVDATPGSVSFHAGDVSPMITLSIQVPPVASNPTSGVIAVSGLPFGMTTSPSPVNFVGSFGAALPTSLRLVSSPSTPPGTYTVVFTAPGTIGSAGILVTVLANGSAGAALSPEALALCAGGPSETTNLQLTSLNGFAGTVLAELVNLPAGLDVTPTGSQIVSLPPDHTIPFTFSAPPTTTGLFNLSMRVRELGGGAQQMLPLVVTVEQPDLLSNIVPPTISIERGGAPASAIASVAPNRCATGPVTVAATAPPGIAVTPANAVIQPPYAPTAFSIAAAQTVAPGTYDVVLSFSSQAVSSTSTLRVTVTAPVIPPDFALNVTPPDVTIRAGSGGEGTAAFTALYGFNQPVSVTVDADPEVTVTPSTFTLSPGATQRFSIAVAGTAAARTAQIRFSGTAAGVTGPRTATMRVTILPPPDFTLTVVPQSISQRVGDSTALTVSVNALNGFTQTVQVVAPTAAGLTFTPSTLAIQGGGSAPVTVTAARNAQPSSGTLQFVATAPGIATPRTASASYAVLAPPPALVSIAQPAAVAGAVEQTFRVGGEFLQPGATFAFDDPRLRVSRANVLSPSLADVVVTVHADTPAGAYILRATNPDGGRTAAGVPLLVYPPSSLGAPLGVTAAAIVFPASGTAISQGEAIYPRGLLATQGTGTIIGSWYFDGAPFDRFTVTVSGGTPAEIRAHAPIPASWSGGHVIELVLETPEHLVAPAIEIISVQERASRMKLLAPREGVVVGTMQPPSFRWSLLPNCSSAMVEIVDDDPRLRNLPEDLLPVRSFRTTAAEWRPTDRDLASIGTGVKRWRVRPVCAGESLAEPTSWRRFAIVPKSVSLILEPLRISNDGNVALRWSGGTPGVLYLVEVIAPDGTTIYSALTTRPEFTIDASRVTFRSGSTVRITALGPGGTTLGVSGQHTISLSLLSRTGGVRFAQNVSAGRVQKEPAEGARVATQNPRIAASWSNAVPPAQVSMTLDATDVTAVAAVSATGIAYETLLPLEPGTHTVRLSLGPELVTWSFTVATGAAAGTDSAAATTTAVAPDGQRKPLSLHHDWLLTPTGLVTIVRDANDDARLNLSAQTDFSGEHFEAKVNGDIAVKHELDDPNRTVQESRNWVARFGGHQARAREELVVGYTQPDFVDQSQLLTTGLARGGAQAKVRTPAAVLSYYQTFSTRPVGVVAGNIGPEQKLRMFAVQTPENSRYDIRVIGLQTEDEPGFNSAGGDGESIGLFSRFLVHGATVIVEAARGNFTPLSGSTIGDREGNAYRMSVTGILAKTSYALNLRRTDADFVNAANRGFTAGGVPDRTGGDLTLSRLFGRTSLSGQVRYLRDGNSSGQLIPEVTERGANLSMTTALGTRAFLSLTATRIDQEGDAPPQSVLPGTDRSQTGVSATVSETLGRISFSQTLQWQKMDDAISDFASQTVKAATLSAAGALSTYFNLSAVLSGTRSDGAPTVGRNDQILASLQPTISIPRFWISFQPRAMYGRTENSLTDFSTRIEQYAAMLTLNPPIRKSTLGLQFSTDRSRNRFSGQLAEPEFVKRYVATLTWSWNRGTIPQSPALSGLVPLASPVDPLSAPVGSSNNPNRTW